MIKHPPLYFLFVIIIISFSCNKSQSLINQASLLIENAENNKANSTPDDFKKIEVAMKELEQRLYDNREDFTEQQINEIGKLQGRYTGLVLKKGVNDFKKSVNDLGNQIDGFLDGFKSDSNNINENE